MPNPYKRPYLDSSVYIAAIRGESAEPGQGQTSAQVLALAEQGHFQVVASTFVIAEVIKDGKYPPLSSAEEAAIDGFLQKPFIEWVEVDVLVAKAARSIARQHSLKPPDAVHLATAVRGASDQLLSWDSAFPDGAVLEGVLCVRPHLVGLPQPLEGFPGND